MEEGIQATVEFSSSDLCPIVELSAAADVTVESVSTSVCTGGRTESTTEFSVEADRAPDTDTDTDLTEVFSQGSRRCYRFAHDGGVDCPCECLGRHGHPVARYVARDGTLRLTFHAADYEQLRETVAALRERFDDLDIKRLLRSPTEAESADTVAVDRSKLTPRQREVLETAHEMGYFEHPRRANATEVAAALDISPSTFGEHLTAAQAKLFDDIL